MLNFVKSEPGSTPAATNAKLILTQDPSINLHFESIRASKEIRDTLITRDLIENSAHWEIYFYLISKFYIVDSDCRGPSETDENWFEH